jgi:hypothetical protein
MTFRRCDLHQKGGVAGHTAVEHLLTNVYLYAEYHIYLSLNTISILASFSYGPRPSSYSYETNKVPLGIAAILSLIALVVVKLEMTDLTGNSTFFFSVLKRRPDGHFCSLEKTT